MRNDIRAIVFDLGNVLINFDWEIAVKKLNSLKEGAGDKSWKFLKGHSNIIKNFETGRISPEEFLDEFKSELNLNCSNETLSKIFSEIFSPNQFLIDRLPYFKKRFKLYLLSNTNVIHRQFGWGKYNFLNVFDKLFLSYEIGFVKPEAGIFEFVEKVIEASKSELIYIDDIIDYVKTAGERGWNAIHFRGNEILLEDLKKLNLNLTL